MTAAQITERIDAIIAELSTPDMQIAAENSPHTPELTARFSALHAELAELDRMTASAVHPGCDPDYAYYVSILDGTRSAFALGPFATHDEALAHVNEVTGFVTERDPRGPFYAYGTARASRPYSTDLRGYLPYRPGKLNALLGFTPAEPFA